MKEKNSKIALYVEEFLTPSMTFIYRQLTTLPEHWNAFVITRIHKNEQLFPFDNVFVSPKKIGEKVINMLLRAAGCRYNLLSRTSTKYLSSILKKERPNLIHAHFGPSAFEILPIARKLSIPMVTTFHGYDASKLLSQKSYLKQLKEIFSYSYVLSVSEVMREELINLGADYKKTRCAYIGVPVERFKFISRVSLSKKMKSNATITFLQVSNFVEKKGHKYTLESFCGLLVFYPNAKLILAGDGPLKKSMDCYARELGIKHAVEFVGHKNAEQVNKLMAECDCFVHHSVTSSEGDKEGIPTVLMEAMATGLPVISTIHAGIPELIEHGKTGYLVSEKDTLTYTFMMKKILEDDGLIGHNARINIETNFNLQNQIQKLSNIYEQIVNEKSSDNKCCNGE
jgi:colanic acid/amylovoran biosynthesis glycosyltransferase